MPKVDWRALNLYSVFNTLQTPLIKIVVRVEELNKAFGSEIVTVCSTPMLTTTTRPHPDSDFEYASDSSGAGQGSLRDGELQARLRNSELSRRAKTEGTVEAWLDLIEHQEAMIRIGQGVADVSTLRTLYASGSF